MPGIDLLGTLCLLPRQSSPSELAGMAEATMVPRPPPASRQCMFGPAGEDMSWIVKLLPLYLKMDTQL